MPITYPLARRFHPRPFGHDPYMPTPRMLVVMVAATGVVVAVVVALATGSWAALAIVLAIHFVVTAAVIYYTFDKLGETGDKPDPVAEARIEEEQASR
jgi:membrane protein implicated in regulation of membrane protease activity